MIIKEIHPLDKALRGFDKKSSEFIPIIVKIVSDETGINFEKLHSKSRKKEVVQARQIAMTLAIRMTKASLVTIGDEIGKRDHATVLHAKKTIMNLCWGEKKTMYLVSRIINLIAVHFNFRIVCCICAGTDLLKVAYVDPNTQVFIGYPEQEKREHNYCKSCKAFVSFISTKDYRHYDAKHSVEAIPDSL